MHGSRRPLTSIRHPKSPSPRHPVEISKPSSLFAGLSQAHGDLTDALDCLSASRRCHTSFSLARSQPAEHQFDSPRFGKSSLSSPDRDNHPSSSFKLLDTPLEFNRQGNDHSNSLMKHGLTRSLGPPTGRISPGKPMAPHRQPLVDPETNILDYGRYKDVAGVLFETSRLLTSWGRGRNEAAAATAPSPLNCEPVAEPSTPIPQPSISKDAKPETENLVTEWNRNVVIGQADRLSFGPSGIAAYKFADLSGDSGLFFPKSPKTQEDSIRDIIELTSKESHFNESSEFGTGENKTMDKIDRNEEDCSDFFSENKGQDVLAQDKSPVRTPRKGKDKLGPPKPFPTTPIRLLKPPADGRGRTIAALSDEEDGEPPASSGTKGLLAMRTRVLLAQEWYTRFNETVFDGRLPPKLGLIWNKRITKTAGLTRFVLSSGQELSTHLGIENAGEKLTVQTGDTKVSVKQIELSPKWLTTAERVASTLLHECCHVAQHLLENNHNDPPHGPLFKKWAAIATCRYPEFAVGVRHTYEMNSPHHRWICDQCGHIYQRWAKSIDVNTHACGMQDCKGHLVYQGKFSGEGEKVIQKGQNGFNAFVKEHYQEVKAGMKGKAAPSEVMKVLGEMWRASKAK